MKTERKLAQEVELDRLLAEEFECSPDFAANVISMAKLDLVGFEVLEAIAQPKLSSGGYGDLLIEGRIGKDRAALLIENKITAGPAIRQAERYARHKTFLLEDDFTHVTTLLIAPKGYHGEHQGYDAFIWIEDLIGLIASSNPKREAFRRDILRRAIEKKQSSGVQVHDEGVYELRTRYTDLAEQISESDALGLIFPPKRERTYDRDSWIQPIGHPSFGAGIFIRHRLWTSLQANAGRIDLIFRDPSADLRSQIEAVLPSGFLFEDFSKTGVQVSYLVPRLQPESPFDDDTVAQACHVMSDLVAWYAQHIAPQT